jgi:hypothetical protein
MSLDHFLKGLIVLTALVVPLITTACYIPVPAPPPLSPIEEAVSYDWLIADQHYSEPLNAWVRNNRLERFLLKVYTSGGLAALKSQHGFECTLRPITPPCSNCYVCRGSVVPRFAEQETNLGARDAGHMLIQVDIGPGSGNFSAMTYWERPPLRPKAGK